LHLGIIRRHYTQEEAEKLKQGLCRELEGTKTLENMLEEDPGLSSFEPENVLQIMDGFFSRQYAEAEMIFEEFPEYAETMPAGVRAEYLEPYEQTVQKTRELIDAVRKKADEVFPEELSDEDITRTFREFYKSPEDVWKQTEQSVRALSLLNEWGIRTKKLTAEEARGYQELCDALAKVQRQFIPYLFIE